MSSARLEAFLAKIYVDEQARERFLAAPRQEAVRAGLTEEEIVAVERIDRVGLELTARSLIHKHQSKKKKPSAK